MSKKISLVIGILFICSLIMFATACEKKAEYNSLSESSETSAAITEAITTEPVSDNSVENNSVDNNSVENNSVENNSDSFKNALSEYIGSEKLIDLYIEDFDNDGIKEAYGITGNFGDWSGSYTYVDVNIYFVSANLEVTKVKGDMHGSWEEENGKRLLDTGTDKYITWLEHAFTGASTTYLFGVKDGEAYIPDASGTSKTITREGDQYNFYQQVSGLGSTYGISVYRYYDTDKHDFLRVSDEDISLYAGDVSIEKLKEGYWENNIDGRKLYKFLDGGKVKVFYIFEKNLIFDCELEYTVGNYSITVGDAVMAYTTEPKLKEHNLPCNIRDHENNIDNFTVFFYEVEHLTDNLPEYQSYLIHSTIKEEDMNETSQLIPSDALSYNGHHYCAFRAIEVKSYEDAVKYCKRLGGHLATISSAEENEIVYQAMIDAGLKNAYFGYYRTDNQSDWIWADGSTDKYTNWHDGEPSNNADELYAMYYEKFDDSTWNDGDFTFALRGQPAEFICEWDDN